VHAALIAADEQVRALSHRSGAVDDRSGEGGRAIGRAGVDLQAVAVGAGDAVDGWKLDAVEVKPGNSPKQTVARLRHAVAEDLEDARSIVLLKELVVLGSNLRLQVVFRSNTALLHEDSPAVVTANVFIDSVGSRARSSLVDQVDQGTAISRQRNSLFPHLRVAPGGKKTQFDCFATRQKSVWLGLGRGIRDGNSNED
jgi:hypothetical protein